LGVISPLECFVAGVVVAGVGLGLLTFGLRYSVARYRKLYPEGSPGPFATPGSAATETQDLQRRLQAIESRLSDVEAQLRREVTA
jgi:hypothetical protein